MITRATKLTIKKLEVKVCASRPPMIVFSKNTAASYP